MENRMKSDRFLRSPAIHILVGTCISLILSFGSVWFLGTSPSNISAVRALILLLMLFLSYVTPAVFIILIMYRAFQKRQSRGSRLEVILLSYFSMIAVFTGVYFSMAFIGDHDYAIGHYFYYQIAGEKLAVGNIKRVNPYPNQSRAFVGIEERLWGTVDDNIPVGVYLDLEDIERYRARWGALEAFEGVVKFKRNSVPAVLSDCLHLSVLPGSVPFIVALQSA